MDAMACDMCGGDLIVERRGKAVCESCGTRYSRTSLARRRTATVPAEPDGTEKIDNYLEIARVAFDDENYSEVIDYCNKIIEEDIYIWDAWFMKAASLACSLEGTYEEVLHLFRQAFEMAPESVAEDMCSDIAEYLHTMADELLEGYFNRLRSDFCELAFSSYTETAFNILEPMMKLEKSEELSVFELEILEEHNKYLDYYFAQFNKVSALICGRYINNGFSIDDTDNGVYAVKYYTLLNEMYLWLIEFNRDDFEFCFTVADKRLDNFNSISSTLNSTVTRQKNKDGALPEYIDTYNTYLEICQEHGLYADRQPVGEGVMATPLGQKIGTWVNRMVATELAKPEATGIIRTLYALCFIPIVFMMLVGGLLIFASFSLIGDAAFTSAEVLVCLCIALIILGGGWILFTLLKARLRIGKFEGQ